MAIPLDKEKTMTENMAKKIGLGLLVLGLLGTYPLSSYAESLGTTIDKAIGAQIIRTGGDKVAKAIAKKNGINENNVFSAMIVVVFFNLVS